MRVSRVVFLSVVVAAIATFCAVVDRTENFVFSPEVLHQAAIRGIAKAKDAAVDGNPTTEQTINAVIAEVAAVYPNEIESTGEWVFNKAGGAMGMMTVLHNSFSEYLIIFGTPVGTEGHSGRYFAEDYFMILEGEQWVGRVGKVEREVYGPGDSNYLPRHTAIQYRMPSKCFALEYARGNIVSMFFFGFIETFTSTLDFHSLYDTIRVSLNSLIPNTLRGKI